MEEISKEIKKIILGKNEDLTKIINLIKEKTRDKDQDYFNKLDKNKLTKIVKISEILRNKKSLSEIDKARLENILNKRPKFYYWKKSRYRLDYNKLKEFVIFVNKKLDLNKKDLENWVNFLIRDNIKIEENFYENNNKDIRLEISLEDYSNKFPEIEIFFIGKKKYKKVILDSLDILS